MLAGRERELAEMEAALTRVAEGSGALALLSGEPGIGKTRLAAEISGRARRRGMTPAWGRCWEGHGAPAYWPWIEAFESLGVSFPGTVSVAGSDPAEARFALFREVARALGSAATRAPLVIVLEDLHAADASTLRLLELVAGQLHGMAVMIVGTFRDLEARLRAESSESMARLCRLGQVLKLPRLAAPEVAALVRDTLERADEALVSSVFETTQGNPLFVVELVRDFRAQGAVGSHGAHGSLPLGVREVIRERLELLPPEARATLEAAAVLGVEFHAADVARMVPGAAGHLETAERRGMLALRDDRMRFSHALYREALYQELGHDRRRQLHREAARALSATSAPLSSLAHHLLEGGPEVIQDAVDHAVRAASLALDVFAFEDAQALLERAQAIIPAGPEGLRARGRLLVALGEAKIRSGDPTGRQSCVEAAAIARTAGDATLLALSGLAYGAVLTMGGVDPVLVGILEEALGRLPEDDSPLRARVMARLAAARQPSAPDERAPDIELALEAVAMARRVADRRDRLAILHAASGALYGAVDPIVRASVSREQEQLAEELGDLTRLLHARVRLAIDHLELSDFAAYAALADAYERLAVRIGPAAAPWRVPLMRSMLALAGDRFAESERWQEQARRLGGDDPRARRAVAFHRIGFLRAAERHDELFAALPELRGLWLAMPYGAVLADARVASSLARMGRDDELHALLRQMPDEVIAEQINATALVDVLWATADVELAERLEPELQQLGERSMFYWFDCEIVEAPNARSRAIAAAVAGRWDECEGHLARALAAMKGIGRRALAARIRFELGDLFVRKEHDLERARALLAAARSEAQALGLNELVALIDRRHPGSQHLPRAELAPAAFAMVLEGEYYAISTARGETLRFKVSRGMQYLASLVERPDTDVHVLELVGSAGHADRGDAGELVDATALGAYRARLAALRDALETAEQLGDGERAERARDEMEAIAAEIARSTHKGGRSRRGASAVDRARSAVQRRIKDALDRIAAQDAELGGWLRRSVVTGNYCKFRLAP